MKTENTKAVSKKVVGLFGKRVCLRFTDGIEYV